ncbi:MAG: NAD(P)H-hydrate dehydratase [Tannerellaceae bacterium]|jgi:NAD(P)H-hydrate epimerase|nr:NAD(P)H-hydrate dehydratase [Tannerellaceae bacterium]
MIKIFTTRRQKELDKFTIENEPVTSTDLVERASVAFVQEFSRRYSRQTRTIVFAGQGNNGADALAIARLLSEESFTVEAYLLNPTRQLSHECEHNKRRIINECKMDFTEVSGEFIPPTLGKWDVVIDGLFGSGLNRPLEGGYAAVVQYINQSEATVISIDIPSGLFGEDNRSNNPDAIIRADFTFTFGAPKLSFLLPENAAYPGQWKTLDIGLHPVAVEKTHTPYRMVEESDIVALIHPRDRFAHKGYFGHALLIAGSKGKMGASLLAAKACLRSGAGLLTVHIPQRGEQIFQTALPESMLSIDPHTERFTNAPELAPYTAVAIGPGLGCSLETAGAFERVLERAGKAIVIDADGINLLASNHDLFAKIPPKSILTPHPKEFDRMAGESASGYDRLLKAQAFAAERDVYVVLKGAYTALCTPEENVYFNSSGNPGMATAGSGDVLTGVLLGLLAHGYSPEHAALLGVYLHGVAGDLAAAFYSEESMIAGDITEMLGKAFKQIK